MLASCSVRAVKHANRCWTLRQIDSGSSWSPRGTRPLRSVQRKLRGSIAAKRRCGSKRMLRRRSVQALRTATRRTSAASNGHDLLGDHLVGIEPAKARDPALESPEIGLILKSQLDWAANEWRVLLIHDAGTLIGWSWADRSLAAQLDELLALFQSPHCVRPKRFEPG